jgi:uncharacterized membrane protein
MVAAALALVGVLLSVYLTLHRLGMIGPIACGSGQACDTVQLGPYGALFGIPVAGYGVAGYLAILVAALVGLQDRFLVHPGPTRAIVLLSGAGVAFTIYLTYLELFVIHAVCTWCVGSAVVIASIFVAGVIGLKSARGERRQGD